MACQGKLPVLTNLQINVRDEFFSVTATSLSKVRKLIHVKLFILSRKLDFIVKIKCTVLPKFH